NLIHILIHSIMKKLILMYLLISAFGFYYAAAQSVAGSSYFALNTVQSEQHEKSFIPTPSESILSGSAELRAYAQYLITVQFVFANLSPLKKNFRVGDIYFDLDDASIREDAHEELDKLVYLLSANPGIQVAITSHADSRIGSYNHKLAQERSLAAKAYL